MKMEKTCVRAIFCMETERKVIAPAVLFEKFWGARATVSVAEGATKCGNRSRTAGELNSGPDE